MLFWMLCITIHHQEYLLGFFHHPECLLGLCHYYYGCRSA
jgi:hypothetical protein